MLFTSTKLRHIAFWVQYTHNSPSQILALNELYKKDGRDGVAFGRREISGEGTWLAPADDGDPNRKTKKNMAKVQCKACGQVGFLQN